MTILTLLIPFTDKVHSVLNGKLLVLKKDPNTERGAIIDIQTKEILVETTRILSIVSIGNNVTVKTESGTIYSFIKVSSLIPTSNKRIETEEAEEAEETEVVEETTTSQSSDFCYNPTVLEVSHKSQLAHYCDQYFQYTYKFAEVLTEAEFLYFCENVKKYKIEPRGAWYESYSSLIQEDDDGRVWTYRFTEPYTD